MSFTSVNPPESPPLSPIYSQGARAGSMLFTSGIVAVDAVGKTIAAGDVKAQTRHILETIKGIVETAGGSMSDVAFNHIFIRDFAHYAAMNEVYQEFFPSSPPARYCVRADLAREDWLVEIASVACLEA